MYKTTAVCVAVTMVAVLIPGASADPPATYPYTAGVPVQATVDGPTGVTVVPNDEFWSTNVPVQLCADFANGDTDCTTVCGKATLYTNATTGPVEHIEVTILPLYLVDGDYCGGTTGTIYVDGF